MIIENSLKKLVTKKSHQFNIFFNIDTIALTGNLIEIIKTFEKEIDATIDEPESNSEISLHRITIPGFNNKNSTIIINEFIFADMSFEDAKKIIDLIKDKSNIDTIVQQLNGNPLDHILSKLLSPIFKKNNKNSILQKAVDLSPEEILQSIKDSHLIEKGKTSLPIIEKWETFIKNNQKKGYILFYTDEGIPGIYSDAWNILRNIRTILEGMIITGYATGVANGIFFLRNEYFYMKEYIESVISKIQKDGFIGDNIAGKKNFNFKISIRKGVGAYIAGGETALIVSSEGKKDDFGNRNLYSAEKNYHGESALSHSSLTFCSITNIIDIGSNQFNSSGTEKSKGTRHIIICGDCDNPGFYNISYGTSIQEIISITKSKNIEAVILGGPSGEIISSESFSRTISFEENSAVSNIIFIKSKESIPEIAFNFLNFFEYESCGWCVPCRTGSTQIKNKFKKILSKKGIEKDIKDLQDWSKIITKTSRCGLGKRCPMPAISSLQNFSELFNKMLIHDSDFVSEFDINAATKNSFIKR
jgi:[NiFe] hydrogenase diaphorase moiety large subunit